jgi:HEPN domain-containing protein
VVPSEEVFFTHSIYELIQMACENDPDFGDVKDTVKLDQYYIPTRYPNGLPGGVPSRFYNDPKEAEEAMILAKKIVTLIERKLKMIG